MSCSILLSLNIIALSNYIFYILIGTTLISNSYFKNHIFWRNGDQVDIALKIAGQWKLIY